MPLPAPSPIKLAGLLPSDPALGALLGALASKLVPHQVGPDGKPSVLRDALIGAAIASTLQLMEEKPQETQTGAPAYIAAPGYVL